MDMTAYSYNDEYGSETAGRILFNGQLYTPEQIREFAQNLTDLADKAEEYLPKEETQWYKEEQAEKDRISHDHFRFLYYETPISRYVQVWEEGGVDGQEDPFAHWLEQDGDKIAQIKAFMKGRETVTF